MAVGSYPKRILVKVFDDNEVVKCSRFKFENNFRLKYIRGFFLIRGTIAGTEKIRFKVYSDSAYSKLLYTGDWSEFSTIPNINRTKNSWHGWLTSEFSEEWINNQFYYYVGCEISGYTRNATTFFTALRYDHPFPTHISVSSSSATSHPKKIEIFGREKREA